jgi:hypothetical protein
MTADPTTMTKLDDLLTAIRAFPDPRRAGDQWKQVFKLLSTTGLPAGRITGVVGMRDPARLAELLEQLRAPGGVPTEPPPEAQTLHHALKAFRKRQALTQLDDESKLGHSPLSKGASPRRTAITPPNEWPDAVWQELVRQGRLRYVGHGLYELVPE